MEFPTHEAIRPRLEEIREAARKHSSTNPRFLQKMEGLADPVRGAAFLRHLYYELRLAGIGRDTNVVLDSGCGTGRHSIVFALMGASRVEALDMNPLNAESFAGLIRDVRLPISVQLRDVADTGVASQSVDFVFCNEAISHFQDHRGFLREVIRVMAPGGRVLISDWNNGANPGSKRDIYRMWLKSETGPFIANDYPPGEVNTPYLFRRWMLIRREFPGFTDQEVFHLGLRTAGVGGEELLKVCREFEGSRQFPPRSYEYGQSQRRPENGQTNEEPIDPREIVRLLAQGRIRSRALPYVGFNRSRAMPVVNRMASLLAPLALFVVRKYVVVGRKDSA